MGCRAGTVVGGGSTTITVQSTADGTIILGCHTDASISDSGTNTKDPGQSNYVY